jgi:hypothetical protein
LSARVMEKAVIAAVKKARPLFGLKCASDLGGAIGGESQLGRAYAPGGDRFP